MPEITMTLARHFFRRMFDNDVIDSDGDTVTTVVRALAVVAMPGLVLAFFLQNSYPARSMWGRIEDQYFFVMFSFVAMAGVAIFEWEMLFPERIDFLVLAPLPIRASQLLTAKALALAGFLALFLVAANLFGAFMLPAVSMGLFWRMVWAQSVATLLAGAFASLAVLASGALLLCILPPASFRRALWLLQVLGTATLALLVIAYARFGDSLDLVLREPGTVARFLPPVWFLGIYEGLLHGSAAQGFATPSAHRAWIALGVAGIAAVTLYPLAWVRMQRMAVQGEATRARRPLRAWASLQDRWVPRPTERAIFSFIGKTMSRNSRYQVLLALYLGVGLALAFSCALTGAQTSGGQHLVLSRFGMHAVLPLLLFWVVAGLHTAFAVPQMLPARWLFRSAGVEAQACVQAARRWTTAIGWLILGVVSAGEHLLHWDWLALLVQGVWGGSFCAVLVESFFVAQRGAPFTTPRAPGKTNLPVLLTLYVGVLPPLVFAIAWLEVRAETHLRELFYPVLLSAALYVTLRWVRAKLVWLGEETETAEGDFQLLGLNGQLRA